MDPMSLIGGVLGIGGKLIDKIWPDPAEAAKARLALMEAQQRGDLAALDAELKTALAQIEVNKAEAQSGNWFAAGWRPAVGWTCAAAFAWAFVLQPFGQFIAAAVGHPVTLPALDLAGMMPVLLGMLGLGSMRTLERINGVANGQPDEQKKGTK